MICLLWLFCSNLPSHFGLDVVCTTEGFIGLRGFSLSKDCWSLKHPPPLPWGWEKPSLGSLLTQKGEMPAVSSQARAVKGTAPCRNWALSIRPRSNSSDRGTERLIEWGGESRASSKLRSPLSTPMQTARLPRLSPDTVVQLPGSSFISRRHLLIKSRFCSQKLQLDIVLPPSVFFNLLIPPDFACVYCRTNRPPQRLAHRALGAFSGVPQPHCIPPLWSNTQFNCSPAGAYASVLFDPRPNFCMLGGRQRSFCRIRPIHLPQLLAVRAFIAIPALSTYGCTE